MAELIARLTPSSTLWKRVSERVTRNTSILLDHGSSEDGGRMGQEVRGDPSREKGLAHDLPVANNAFFHDHHVSSTRNTNLPAAKWLDNERLFNNRLLLAVGENKCLTC